MMIRRCQWGRDGFIQTGLEKSQRAMHYTQSTRYQRKGEGSIEQRLSSIIETHRYPLARKNKCSVLTIRSTSPVPRTQGSLSVASKPSQHQSKRYLPYLILRYMTRTKGKAAILTGNVENIECKRGLGYLI